MQQIGPNVKVVQCILPRQQPMATTDSAAVDSADFDEALIVLECGTFQVSGTAKVTVQESVDSAFTSPVDISGAAFAEVTDANDEQIYVGVVQLEPGRLRYLRIRSVVAAATEPLAVTIILAKARTKPAQTLVFNL